jgi:MFS family permease
MSNPIVADVLAPPSESASTERLDPSDPVTNRPAPAEDAAGTDMAAVDLDPLRPSGRDPGDGASDPPAPTGIANRFRWSPYRTLLLPAPFRWLLGGQALALVADQAFFVALSWFVLQQAGAGSAFGTVLGASAVPGVMLLPLGGLLVDRVGPVRMMLVAGTVRVAMIAVLAGLALSGGAALWQIALVGGALSAADALYYPASMAAVPSVVPRDRLVPANSLLQGLEQLSGVVGPVIAGSLIALIGVGATFGVVAVAFAGAAAAYAGLARALARTRRDEQGTGAMRTDPSAGARRPRSRGWARHARRTPVRPGRSAAADDLPDPRRAERGAGRSADGRRGGPRRGEVRRGGGVRDPDGLLRGRLPRWFAGDRCPCPGREARPRILAATALLGVGLGGLALAPSLPVAGAIGVAMGAVAGYLAVVLTAWLQERAPEAIRGRVMAVVMFAVVALDPVAFALSGFLAGAGVERLFLAAAGLLIGTAALGATNRVVRSFD